jgi:hypothetical protein
MPGSEPCSAIIGGCSCQSLLVIDEVTDADLRHHEIGLIPVAVPAYRQRAGIPSTFAGESDSGGITRKIPGFDFRVAK